MARRNAVVLVADAAQFSPSMFLAHRLRTLNRRPDVDIIVASNAPPLLAQARAFDADQMVLDLTSVDSGRRLPVRSYLTRATYLRLFLPGLLRRRYARILYLDSDVYPESEQVFRLFDLDMGGHAVAAVRDLNVPFVPSHHNADELNATLGLKGDVRFIGLFGAKYLNGGVELFDVDAFVAARLEKKMMELLRGRLANPLWMDQTLLNAVLRTDWLELSPSFNLITRAWLTSLRHFAPAAIVHFTGQLKPWSNSFALDHPARAELIAFLARSPWRTFIIEANRVLTGSPAPPIEQPVPWGPVGAAAIIRYLRETSFADVEQGLTTLNPAALPASF
ncbi:MAG: glycosyltransferase [Bauldia sp.]